MKHPWVLRRAWWEEYLVIFSSLPCRWATSHRPVLCPVHLAESSTSVIEWNGDCWWIIEILFARLPYWSPRRGQVLKAQAQNEERLSDGQSAEFIERTRINQNKLTDPWSHLTISTTRGGLNADERELRDVVPQPHRRLQDPGMHSISTSPP